MPCYCVVMPAALMRSFFRPLPGGLPISHSPTHYRHLPASPGRTPAASRASELGGMTPSTSAPASEPARQPAGSIDPAASAAAAAANPCGFGALGAGMLYGDRGPDGDGAPQSHQSHCMRAGPCGHVPGPALHTGHMNPGSSREAIPPMSSMQPAGMADEEVRASSAVHAGGVGPAPSEHHAADWRFGQGGGSGGHHGASHGLAVPALDQPCHPPPAPAQQQQQQQQPWAAPSHQLLQARQIAEPLTQQKQQQGRGAQHGSSSQRSNSSGGSKTGQSGAAPAGRDIRTMLQPRSSGSGAGCRPVAPQAPAQHCPVCNAELRGSNAEVNAHIDECLLMLQEE